MKTINKVTGVIFGVSLLLASGTIVANDKKVEIESEANARGIEKSDIKRGMQVEKQQDAQDGGPKRAGDPIPGIDITVNQGHSVCQSGSDDCNVGNASAEHVIQQKGGVKLKGGKTLAETVKSVDKGDDVKHIDEDSDDDGLPEQ
ncbi:hypothetical protein [Kangiella koreensis]|uniref:Secreted protein n=1 Tax=Kangiella koreensis (strain DSM 16069 / JCM 12317 / KCTC 12182 / SW-125) TaxID=523791 RepID=C7R6L8_KANKD|nr:hypothetical protein [Kangiella koreensis]ACV25534.1 hypothetical protein Kkor_0113 [Kangiella koreensis DSM 16069]